MRSGLTSFLYAICVFAITNINSESIASVTSTPKQACENKKCQSKKDISKEKKIYICLGLVDSDAEIESKILKSKINRDEQSISEKTVSVIFPVEGYAGSSYVFGEIVFIDKTKIEGFIYSNNKKIYIFGVVEGKNRINAYDKNGNYFALISNIQTPTKYCYSDN